jgi:hypothetical protein
VLQKQVSNVAHITWGVIKTFLGRKQMSNQTLASFVNKVAAIVSRDDKQRYVVRVDGAPQDEPVKQLMPHNGFQARLQKMTEHGLENVREVKPFYYISTLSGHDWRAKRDYLIQTLKSKGVLTGA